jgi:hypothetical protein
MTEQAEMTHSGNERAVMSFSAVLPVASSAILKAHRKRFAIELL